MDHLAGVKVISNAHYTFSGLAMKIRKITKKSSNINCRECHDEIWEPFYTANHGPNVDANRQHCFDLEKERREDSVLYALEADTASGTKVEVMCEVHLSELYVKIDKLLKGEIENV